MKDRLKRMITVSGYKVWPAEVENALYGHPAVHEACVIATRDARQGEAVKALVVLKPGHRGRSRAADRRWCRETMAVYKAPRFVEFVDAAAEVEHRQDPVARAAAAGERGSAAGQKAPERRRTCSIETSSTASRPSR